MPNAMSLESAQPWWKGAVIYQIYPRSYQDTNGDGVGDLNGITQRLDHVASLGVDGVWISPFFTSPMRDFGYDVADYCDVDPAFGTLEDFDALLSRAHALGLKIIIDQVYAHSSDAHAWFAESREDRTNARADWYVWSDPKPDGTPPNNWQAVFGGPSWTWDARRQQYYMHNFLPSQPQLNLHNPDVQDALVDVMRFWLDRGVDGFRLDALNFSLFDPDLRDNPPKIPAPRNVSRPFDLQEHVHNQSHPDLPKFLKRLRMLMDEYGEIFSVAEVPGPSPLEEMRAYTEGEQNLNSAYNFDFLYAKRLGAEAIATSQSNWLGAPGEGWPSWAFSNHDAPRCVSRWLEGADPVVRAKLTTALLFCLRGNPILYQGEELGLPQAEIAFEDLQDPEAIANWPRTLGRDGARTPMPWASADTYCGFSDAKPWLPLGQGHADLAVDLQEADPQSMLQFTRTLARVRASSPALQYGEIEFIDLSGDLLVFRRLWEGETIECVFNIGGTEVVAAMTDVSSDQVLMCVGIDSPNKTRVPPYSCRISRH
ncbi:MULTISPECIES: alpha-amylase family glycosyl hydrolase [unclassified Hyphomonas]|jgi:alpha-glucosidase|uniref:alpha-amylase family glycosyl hydrolase n=7 Tax=Hyphomonas TaxID=85 RepID=UPI0025C4D2F4|nr:MULTISPECIES: alpha-amylase family glycosyl hydrolase [unclassified Hyphomonas]|tara:strand:- start:24086 stop:25702 length:1617 start_codon:yes stop_codon:yes gene_type:complete